MMITAKLNKSIKIYFLNKENVRFNFITLRKQKKVDNIVGKDEIIFRFIEIL